MEGATRAFVPPPCINERFWWRGVKQDFEPHWRDGVLLYFLALFSPRKLLASYVVGLVVLFFLFIFHLSVIPALFSFAGSFPANPFRNSGKFKLHQILVPVLVPPAVVVLEVVQYSLVHSTSTFYVPPFVVPWMPVLLFSALAISLQTHAGGSSTTECPKVLPTSFCQRALTIRAVQTEWALSFSAAASSWFCSEAWHLCGFLLMLSVNLQRKHTYSQKSEIVSQLFVVVFLLVYSGNLLAVSKRWARESLCTRQSTIPLQDPLLTFNFTVAKGAFDICEILIRRERSSLADFFKMPW